MVFQEKDYSSINKIRMVFKEKDYFSINKIRMVFQEKDYTSNLIYIPMNEMR